MSYEVMDGETSLGQFASNKGMSDLSAYCRKWPAAGAFLRTGLTRHTGRAAQELREAAKTAPPDIAETARVLAKLISGKALAVISNGIR